MSIHRPGSRVSPAQNPQVRAGILLAKQLVVIMIL